MSYSMGLIKLISDVGFCFMHINLAITAPVDVPAPYVPRYPQTLCWPPSRILFCHGFSLTYTLINVVVPVSCIWIWSSLCLLMSWPRRCQAIRRHCADHPAEYCSVRISASTFTLVNIIILVSCLWMWSSLCCLWMPWPRSCQAIHRHSTDQLNEYCIVKVSVFLFTLINIFSCIWIWFSP